jgi:hypothetical protein
MVLSRNPLTLEQPEPLKPRDTINYCKRHRASQKADLMSNILPYLAKRFDAVGWLCCPLIMPRKGQPCYDTCWRKSRIAARILLRDAAAKLTSRDVALGRKFALDKGVTPRLIDQVIHGIRGKKNRLARERRAAA